MKSFAQLCHVLIWESALSIALVQNTLALSLVGQPQFTPSDVAPLAGTLQISTDVPSRVNVFVTDGIESWSRNFLDYSTNHMIPLYGFRPGRTNEITIKLHDTAQEELTVSSPVIFLTDPLPSGFPVINVLESKPELMEPGYTLIHSVNPGQAGGYTFIVNHSGEVVWYTALNLGLDVRPLPNGDLFSPNIIALNEIDLLGNYVQQWGPAGTFLIDPHEAIRTSRDTFIYITPAEATLYGFPSSLTNATSTNTPVTVLYNHIVEMSANDSTLLNDWSLFDLLDPYRSTYLTYTPTGQGLDTEHSNALLEDPRDGNVIVSLRDQNAVVKFDRTTGQLKWILGPPENWSAKFQPFLLKPVSTPFEWNYGQHAPTYTPHGTLLLYDDGNFRATPPDAPVPDASNYSRAAEFEINEETMEVRQVWEYGANIAEPLFTPAVGSAFWLPQTEHVLITFGIVTYVDHHHPSPTAPGAPLARIKEVTHNANPEVVFDLALFDYKNTDPAYPGTVVYRSYRIPDLYAHPAAPVTDLSTTIEKRFAYLHFSGDPTHSYSVQASTDLREWTELGQAQVDEEGTGTFLDEDSENVGTRFYRIETK